MSNVDLEKALEAERAIVEEALTRCLDSMQGPSSLVEAMRYIVLGGGKRVRPILVLSTARALCGDENLATSAACALEMVHCYSLAHDDLPALDNDDERRGKPSAHIRFDEALAILAGDALLTEAFRVIVECQTATHPRYVSRMVGSLALAAGAGGMVGGQVIDIRHEAETASELRRMHAMKTGALFRSALELGALAGELGREDVAKWGRFGELFGAAFQLSDDVLDLDEIAGNGHEQQVNIAHIDGVDAVRSEIAELCSEAIQILDAFGREVPVHRALVEWVEKRALPAQS